MNEQRSFLPWVLGGCGLLLLLCMCALFGAGALLFVRSKPADFDLAPPDIDRPPLPNSGPAIPDSLGSGPAVPPSDTSPRQITATITSSTGLPDLTPGTTCQFTVDYRRKDDESGGFWCRSNVRCGSRVLFGFTPNSGYFECTLIDAPRGVRGSDGSTTSQDTADPAFSIDTDLRTLEVHDDTGPLGAFAVAATITAVQ